jgi:hypothetical protein
VVQLVSRPEEVVVEPEVDHLDAVRLETYALKEALLDMHADRDHRARLVERQGVRVPAVELTDPLESPHEFPRVGVGTADDTRDRR